MSALNPRVLVRLTCEWTHVHGLPQAALCGLPRGLEEGAGSGGGVYRYSRGSWAHRPLERGLGGGAGMRGDPDPGWASLAGCLGSRALRWRPGGAAARPALLGQPQAGPGDGECRAVWKKALEAERLCLCWRPEPPQPLPCCPSAEHCSPEAGVGDAHRTLRTGAGKRSAAPDKPQAGRVGDALPSKSGRAAPSLLLCLPLAASARPGHPTTHPCPGQGQLGTLSPLRSGCLAVPLHAS